MPLTKVWVLMDESPGPDSQFVEVEDAEGRAHKVEWEQQGRYWRLGPFYIGEDADAEIGRLNGLLDPVREQAEVAHYLD